MPVYLTCGQQPFLQFSDRAQQQFSTAHLASNVVNTVKVGFRVSPTRLGFPPCFFCLKLPTSDFAVIVKFREVRLGWHL